MRSWKVQILKQCLVLHILSDASLIRNSSNARSGQKSKNRRLLDWMEFGQDEVWIESAECGECG